MLPHCCSCVQRQPVLKGLVVERPLVCCARLPSDALALQRVPHSSRRPLSFQGTDGVASLVQERLPEGTQDHFRSIVTDQFCRVLGSGGSIYAVGDAATIQQVPPRITNTQRLLSPHPFSHSPEGDNMRARLHDITQTS